VAYNDPVWLVRRQGEAFQSSQEVATMATALAAVTREAISSNDGERS
jgi:hypothetical protein